MDNGPVKMTLAEFVAIGQEVEEAKKLLGEGHPITSLSIYREKESGRLSLAVYCLDRLRVCHRIRLEAVVDKTGAKFSELVEVVGHSGAAATRKETAGIPLAINPKDTTHV